MSSSAGCSSLALHTDDQKESSDDRPVCLENPRPAGAESTLTENVASPFQAESRQGTLGSTVFRVRRTCRGEQLDGWKRGKFFFPSFTEAVDSERSSSCRSPEPTSQTKRHRKH